tara:strand:+ start:10491 stop:11396 length:906 start_codon:yes stop_codon:yes gene_type:complete
MITFPASTVFIEGPDCSGKTSLINQIHRDTGYRWHIMDRSQISRKIFNSFYGREISNIDDSLHFEISNLNNLYFILLPDFSVIRGRFEKRGDEIHDLDSLHGVYRSFRKFSEFFRGCPNISTFSFHPGLEEFSKSVCSLIDFQEKMDLSDISTCVEQFVRYKENEAYPVQFMFYDDGKFEDASSASMSYEPELDYYEKIYSTLHDKITKELTGKNEYQRRESEISRRFVYTDNSCISFIQVAVREDIMDFHVVIRSSNVKDTFQHDLRFLYYLGSTCFKRFSSHCNKARFRFNLNSAHIIL